MSPKAREKTLDYYLSLPYKVEIIHDEDGWFAKVLDLPGCMTWANSYEELKPMIEDAKLGWIEDALEHGDPVPEPRNNKDFSGKVNLRMPKSLHRDLTRQAEDEGVSLNQLMVAYLARGLGRGSIAGQNAAHSQQRDEESAQEITSRDWPQVVRRTLEEYEELLQKEDLTPLASSRIVTNSTKLLTEFSDELTSISNRAVETSKKIIADTKKPRYSPRKLNELEKTFDSLTQTYHALRVDFGNLEEFASQAIEEYKARFGDEADEDAYSAVREAETILQRARTNVQQLEE
jgi:antitoxin HicB